jgi:hypothetical protein
MKTIINTTLLTLVLAIAATVPAQQAKVAVVDGHCAPLSAQITYRGGKTRNVIVVRSWYNLAAESWPEIHGIGDGGSDVKLWLDTIAEVKETSDKEFTLVMKNGSERTFGYSLYYTGFVLQNPEGGMEFVPMSGFKSLQFLGPVRKDSKEFAMFDQWKFSPFTGERLSDLDR